MNTTTLPIWSKSLEIFRLEGNVTNLMYLAGELAKHDESVKEVDNSDENYDDSAKKKRTN